jgi:F420-0:gamma-glutamyl ligase
MKAIEIIPIEKLPLIAKGDRLEDLIVNSAEKQGTPIQE